MSDAHRDEIAKLEALYAENPEGRIFTHLAEACRKAGDLDRAREVLTDGIERHPDYSSAHVVLGRVLMDLEQYDESRAEFRRVLELDGQNLVALRSLGDIARTEGRTQDALDRYNALLELEPADQEVLEIVAELSGATAEEPAVEEPAEAGAAEEQAAEEAAWNEEEWVRAGDVEGEGWSTEATAVEEDDWPAEPATDEEPAADELEPEPAAAEDVDEGGVEADDKLPEPAAEADETVFAWDAGGESAEDEAEDEPEDELEAEPEDEAEGIVEPADAGATAAGDSLLEPFSMDAFTEGSDDIDVMTETIAQVYARQGLYDRAAEVYRELVRARPDDEQLQERLAEMEEKAASTPEEGVAEDAPHEAETAEADTAGAMAIETEGIEAESVEVQLDEAEADPSVVEEVEADGTTVAGFEPGGIDTGADEDIAPLAGLETDEKDPETGLVDFDAESTELEADRPETAATGAVEAVEAEEAEAAEPETVELEGTEPETEVPEVADFEATEPEPSEAEPWATTPVSDGDEGEPDIDEPLDVDEPFEVEAGFEAGEELEADGAFEPRDDADTEADAGIEEDWAAFDQAAAGLDAEDESGEPESEVADVEEPAPPADVVDLREPFEVPREDASPPETETAEPETAVEPELEAAEPAPADEPEEAEAVDEEPLAPWEEAPVSEPAGEAGVDSEVDSEPWAVVEEETPGPDESAEEELEQAGAAVESGPDEDAEEADPESPWTDEDWSAEGEAETPYAWAESEAGEEDDGSPPIRDYLADLLGWRGEGVEAAPTTESGIAGDIASAGGTSGGGSDAEGESSDDDDDLEMFRSWLESLKK